MKKLISAVLILALLLPAAALADDPVTGCWATYELTNSGTPQVTMVCLMEDHQCYYITHLFLHDSDGYGRTHVGTWEMMPDGTVLAHTGENTSTVLSFDPTYVVAIDTKLNRMFINLNMLYKEW